MSDEETTLEELRRRIGELDQDLVGLAARRLDLARRIGELKGQLGRPTRDFAQERVVLERARAAAHDAGLPAGLAEELMLAMIRRALAVQEQQGLSLARSGQGKRALVVGGAGKMGRWFHRFLGSQGFEVLLADPETGDSGVEQVADWRDAGSGHDVVVLATPLLVANGILESMAEDPPEGLVFDIGSLKSPLRHGLGKLQAAGARVTSIHPMFGPDADVLSGRHVIFVDVGHAEATRQARELFDATAAVQVEMSLDDHGRLIAFVLGLSHALNIAFFTALAESGEPAEALAELSSTTFDDQLEVASRVSRESPDLYFEIQSLNDYGGEALEALESAVARLVASVREGDRVGFSRLMERGRSYLSARAGGRSG